MDYRAQVNAWETETVNGIDGCIKVLEGMMVSSEEYWIDDFDATFIPLVREANQNLHTFKERFLLETAEPLTERILVWREWERLWRPPLTGCTVNPHADA